MNSYLLTAQLRRARRRYRLSAVAQALYYELVAIANDDAWPDTFNCSNAELFNAIGVTENTLIHARLELIQCGLIGYKSNKSKRTFSEYRLLLSTASPSKFDAKADAYPAADVAADTADYNKLKPKPKLKKEVVAVVVNTVISYADALRFFTATRNHHLLRDKFGLDDDGLAAFFKTFYDSKVDFGELDGKTLTDIGKNFYYWLPKHLAAQPSAPNKKGCVKKQNNYQPKTAQQPLRGVAAAMQFAEVQMRE
ncbi:helix-turn-helix domain-containing protein [Mucilaginibacter segetis]|uniref:Helix-turn-helix domain-containing protein n=1 Tax=Mucilaginibacter segetis TaxID=2793071 RepID=A0A934ULQ3_9SPHI|nr:helix-turn-helix domain-containing protein [Mucilaginibacter segetis]MBK0378609.1 helix-turn-helix domain-containing protein [Mucilaginibacter segetis]